MNPGDERPIEAEEPFTTKRDSGNYPYDDWKAAHDGLRAIVARDKVLRKDGMNRAGRQWIISGMVAKLTKGLGL